MRSHILHLVIYSSLVAAFFGILVRHTRRDRLRVAAITWVSMVGGALLLAWLMFPLPK